MAKIIPVGCTAINTFTYPFSEVESEAVYITYRQRSGTIIEKTKEDITFHDDKQQVDVYLTQEDTLAFKQDEQVEIQIRVKLADGSAVKSNIVKTTSDRILKKGVI